MIMYIFVLLMVQNLYLKSNNLNNKQLFQEPKDNIVGLDHRYSNVTESQNDALELLKQQLEKIRPNVNIKMYRFFVTINTIGMY